jgi:hypothetical protein
MGSLKVAGPVVWCFSFVVASFTFLYSSADANANEQTFSNSEPQIAIEQPVSFERSYVVDEDVTRALRDAQRALRFEHLTAQWREERGASSSVTKALMSPSYHSIIGMGEPGLPLIMEKMRSEGDDPDMWFWALEHITGENPIAPEDQGDSVKMAAKWLSWYDENYSG